MELERTKAALIRAAWWILVGLAAVAAVRWLLRPLLPFLVGLLIASLLQPLVSLLFRNSRAGRRGVTVAVILLFYAVVLTILWLLGSALFSHLRELLSDAPELFRTQVLPALERLEAFFSRWSRPAGAQASGSALEAVSAAWEGSLSTLTQRLAEGLSAWIGALPKVGLALLFTILSSALISLDYGRVTGFLIAQMPEGFRDMLRGMREFLRETVLRLIRAYLLLMLVTFLEVSLGLWILGEERFLLMGLLVALVDLLPVFGSGAALLPWALFRAISGAYRQAGGLFLLWVVIAVVRQLLEPRLIGSQLGLHPLMTLLAMYLGLCLAGVGGMLAAPVLCLLLKRLHDNRLIRLYREPPA